MQKKIFGGNFSTLARTSILLLLTISILLYPNQCLTAGRNGFILWTNIVFPSLLPFFVLSELLIQYGIVRFFGSFIDPLARILFKVPGIGGIIFTLSVISGFPSGAKMAVQLLKEGALTKEEAERISTFCNFSNPLFIIGAVSVGMFHSLKLGIILFFYHLLSNILLGVFLGIGKKMPPKGSFPTLIRSEWEHMMFISKEKITFGTRMTDAVRNSIQTLLTIGGFIVIFSVLNTVLLAAHIIPMVSHVLHFLISTVPIVTFNALITGLLEVTIGLKQLSIVPSLNTFQVILWGTILLAFNGFSIHAQVLSILTTENLSYKRFLNGRISQALIGASLVILTYVPFISKIAPFKSLTLAVFSPLHHQIETLNYEIFSFFTFAFLLLYFLYELKCIIRKGQLN